MGLVKGITHELKVPHEPGQWVTVRQLSLDELSQAQAAKITSGLATAGKAIAAVGHDTFKAMQQAYASQQAAVVADPLGQTVNEYDAGTLLRLAVVGWSYETEQPSNPIAQLDARTAEWLLREIVMLHVPVGPTAETDRGNGSSPSISLLRG